MAYLAFVLCLLISTSFADSSSTGTFWLPRTKKCHGVTADSTATIAPTTANCVTFNWADYQTYAMSYTKIRDEAT